MSQTINQFLAVVSIKDHLDNTTITMSVDSIAGVCAEETSKLILISIANKYNKKYNQDIEYTDILIKSLCKVN
jgi:hypothetical protein